MGRVISVFLIAIVAAFGFLFFKKDTVSPESPTPDVYGTSKSNISNDWFPKSKISKNTVSLNILAKSAILVDYDTGEVVYAKNPLERLPAASTIKIMTALVALENKLSAKLVPLCALPMPINPRPLLTLACRLYVPNQLNPS